MLLTTAKPSQPSKKEFNNIDEYPYACTKEGGAGAYTSNVPVLESEMLGANTMLVPESENKSHGGYIGSLIKANEMKTGDKFEIILIPDKEKKKVPESQPVLINVPVPQNNYNPSFMDKMSEITGLTGTALIIYIIISEGTRAIPVRNLAPIP
ncbi:MAG: hypothetical protein IJ916_11000 [Paludibacteraceae bacterium]|nr:hypothetical protein [Paludibacteraceae bacterium]